MTGVAAHCGEVGPFCLWPLSPGPCSYHLKNEVVAVAFGHDSCTAEFCRSPLHPGPCKKWRTPTRDAGRRDTGEPDLPGTSAKPSAKRVPTGKRGDDGHPPAPEGRDLISDRAEYERSIKAVRAQLDTWRAQDAAYENRATEQMRTGSIPPNPEPGELPPSNGNRVNGAAAVQQGFEGRPVVADDASLDAAVAAGGVEFWRGVGEGFDTHRGTFLTPTQAVEQLRTGDAYYGYGSYGNGIYGGTDKKVSSEYAGGQRFGDPGGPPTRGGAVVRMVLRPGSKVIEYGEARDRRKEWVDQMKQVPIDEKMRPEQRTEWNRQVDIASADLGVWATMMGYDAIYADEEKYVRSAQDQSRHFGVLNRGALMISDHTETIEPARGGN